RGAGGGQRGHAAGGGAASGRGTDGVPAAARWPPALPRRRGRLAGRAAVRPVEGFTEAQRSPIFGERVAGLPTPLEDRAEERVDDWKIGRSHLDLFELLGGLVQHLELEVDATERNGEREIVGSAVHRRSIERDHATGAALLP